MLIFSQYGKEMIWLRYEPSLEKKASTMQNLLNKEGRPIGYWNLQISTAI